MKLHQFGFFMSLWWCCGCNLAGQEWDFLMYSQKWPITFCIYYTGKAYDNTLSNYFNRSCILPDNKFSWTIHGLWPSKFHGDGPFFCNASAVFDRRKIVSIERKLTKFWPNLEGGETMDSLWKHEWNKHGTCALDYEPLNDELKYFKKGLSFYSLHNMTSILSSAKIFPDKNKIYDVKFIVDRVKKSFGKIPYVECIKMESTHKFLLYEIRLCFNKNLEPIDCETNHFYKNSVHSVGNCPLNEGISYPNDVI